MGIATMNVVTGVFVSSALAAFEEEKKEQLIKQMADLFFYLDSDGSGGVTLEEFQEQVENPVMMRFLKRVDLVPEDVEMAFSILDKDGSGEIDAEELVSGEGLCGLQDLQSRLILLYSCILLLMRLNRMELDSRR